MFEKLIKNNLAWFPELEIGYYSVSGNPYNKNYFKKYLEYSETEIGRKINETRIKLVLDWYGGMVLDFGIGSGHFIKGYGNAFGYDINPAAVEWLISMDLYRNPYENGFNCVSFWDSLEHIERPEEIINKVKKFVFVSIPIFGDYKDIIKSRHFRKNEHYWYFTHRGIVSWFFENGFECVEHNNNETELGRESIETYVFKRYIIK